jgi:hypothetical protein
MAPIGDLTIESPAPNRRHCAWSAIARMRGRAGWLSFPARREYTARLTNFTQSSSLHRNGCGITVRAHAGGIHIVERYVLAGAVLVGGRSGLRAYRTPRRPRRLCHLPAGVEGTTGPPK